MGTRSLTHVIDESEFHEEPQHLLTFYTQYDGYPEGVGTDLAKFAMSGDLVNGYNLGEQERRQFNGAGCFAAALIANQKQGVGNVYLQAPVLPGDPGGWQEYEYKIRVVGLETGKSFIMEVSEGAGNSEDPIFVGTPEEFMEWVKTHPFGSLEGE